MEYPGLEQSCTSTRQERRPQAPSSSLDLWVTIVTILAALVAGAVLLATRKPKASAQFQDSVCSTSDCVKQATHLSLSMNRDLNPCEDFHLFMCTFSYRDKSYQGPSQLSDALKSDFLANIRDYKVATNSTAVKKSFRMFDSCISRASDMPALKKFMLERRMPWPEEAQDGVHPLDVHLDLGLRWSEHFWFSVKIVQPRQLSDFVVVFWEGQELHRWYRKEDDEASFQKFTERVGKYSDALGYSRNTSTLRVLYDIELLVSRSVRRGKDHATPGKMFRVGDLKNYTGTDKWAEFLTKHLRPEFNITDDSRVMVHNMHVIQQLGQILISATHRNLVNVLGWTFVQQHGWMASSDLDTVTFGNTAGARSHLPSMCLWETEKSFGILPWTPWILHNFPEIERDKVDLIIDSIVMRLKEKIQRSSLLSRVTKDTAIEKLRLMYKVTWPPDYYFNQVSLDYLYNSFAPMTETFFRNWVQSRRDVRSFLGHKDYLYLFKKTMTDHLGPITYLHYFNVLRMSLSQLAPPLYYPYGTYAMNYGYLGTLYATYLGKSMDNLGRRLGVLGLEGDWWSATVAPNCTSSDVERRMLRLLAYEVSYEAFKVAMRSRWNTLRDYRLRTLEGYTGDQVFYMSSCRPYCSLRDEEKYHCNVAMETAGFREAFQCAEKRSWDAEVCRFL